MGVSWATAQGRLLRLFAEGKVGLIRKGRVNVFYSKVPRALKFNVPAWVKALGSFPTSLRSAFRRSPARRKWRGGKEKILKLGLDTSALIASIKKRGEKFHASAVLLSEIIKDRGYRGVASSLVLIESPGALATTAMPIEKFSR